MFCRTLPAVLLALALPACLPMAYAFSAMADGSAAYTPPQVAEADPVCRSDFDCSTRHYGDVCIKEHMSFTGICVTPTNQWGTPAVAGAPRNNVGVMGAVSGGCRWNIDCPVTYRCHTATGACVR